MLSQILTDHDYIILIRVKDRVTLLREGGKIFLRLHHNSLGGFLN